MAEMDYGWNDSAPATKAELIEILENILEAIKTDDSFEGFVEYLMPISSPEDEELAARDPRWAEADFAVRARFRVGNSIGQGGMQAFTKPRHPDAA